MRVRIERVHVGDKINGKKVVEVTHRLFEGRVQLALEDGETVDGCEGGLVEVE